MYPSGHEADTLPKWPGITTAPTRLQGSSSRGDGDGSTRKPVARAGAWPRWRPRISIRTIQTQPMATQKMTHSTMSVRPSAQPGEQATSARHERALILTHRFIEATPAAVGRTVTLMRRAVVGWALGFGLATILWFILSPILTDEQERVVGWLMMGAYAVVIAAVLLRARRKADQGRSS
jgi:hypothetical protein